MEKQFAGLSLDEEEEAVLQLQADPGSRKGRGGFLLGGVFFNSQYHTFSSNEEHHG